MGDYLPSKLNMESGENVLCVVVPGDYKGNILFFFENGKAAKVPLSAYDTKLNRKKLVGAFSDKSPLKSALSMDKDEQVAVYTSDGRAVVFNTALLLPKATRNTQGVSVVSLKKKATVLRAVLASQSGIENLSRYRSRTVPAAGALLKEEDAPEKQISFEV